MNVEQHENVKFCMKLCNYSIETYNLLKEVYGDKCLSTGLNGLKRAGKRLATKSAAVIPQTDANIEKSVKLFDKLSPEHLSNC